MEMLMEQVLSKDNLNTAYKRVKRNKGVCGADGMSIEDAKIFIVNNRDTLIESIMNGTYRPMPVMAHDIPKDDGTSRRLGIPTVIDRIIQQAINQVLMNIYDVNFHDNSFGFRPNRSAQQAVWRAKTYIEDGCEYVVDIDMKKYFDTINQDKLMYLLTQTIKDKRLLKLINRFLKCGVSENGVITKSIMGVSQGGPLSPILSNIYLNELDKELDRRGLNFVRYADDIQIYVKSRRAGHRVLERITTYLEQNLKVEVNQSKSDVRNYSNSKFLGFSFYKRKGSIKMSIHTKSRLKFKNKVRALLKRNRGRNIEGVIKQLNTFTRGWINYYKISNNSSFVKEMDSWIRRKIRVYIWKQWKKISTRKRNLVNLGIPIAKAWEYANTRKGLWRISKSPILSYTLTNDYIGNLGLLNLNKLYSQ